MDPPTIPVYVEKDDVAASGPPSTKSITPAGICHIHGSTETPMLDAQVADPHTKASLSALSSALADASNEGACLKCTVEAITQTLTTFLQDFRTAKKSGQWSHDEKKALKTEVKGLAKGMKHDLKQALRSHALDSRRAVARGLYWKR